MFVICSLYILLTNFSVRKTLDIVESNYIGVHDQVEERDAEYDYELSQLESLETEGDINEFGSSFFGEDMSN